MNASPTDPSTRAPNCCRSSRRRGISRRIATPPTSSPRIASSSSCRVNAGGLPLIYLCGHSLGLGAARRARLRERGARRLGGTRRRRPSHRDASVDRLRAELHQGAAARHRRAGERSRRDEFAHREPASDDGVVLSPGRHARQGAHRSRRVFIGPPRDPRTAFLAQARCRRDAGRARAARRARKRCASRTSRRRSRSWAASWRWCLWPGVQYRTGQAFDCARITRAAHDAGAIAGFDMAHAIGNLPLALHEWDVDFAVWCSYKYLNAGPGAIGGAFMHERHFGNAPSRLSGWWGHEPQTRFQMAPEFRPATGAAGWAVSNPPIFSAAPLLASLEMFRAADIGELRAKSVRLTAYAERMMRERTGKDVQIITPEAAEERGCSSVLRVERRPATRPAHLRCARRSRHRLRLARTGHHPRRAHAALQPVHRHLRAGRRPRRRAQGNCLSLTSVAGVNIVGAGLAGSLLAHPAGQAWVQGYGVRASRRIRGWPSRWRTLHQSGAGRARHPRPEARRRARARHAARHSACAAGWCTNTMVPPRCRCTACGRKKSSIPSRAANLNRVLIDAAAELPNVTLHFGQLCLGLAHGKNVLEMRDEATGRIYHTRCATQHCHRRRGIRGARQSGGARGGGGTRGTAAITITRN